MNIVKLTKKEATALINQKKGLFNWNADNQKKYSSSYIGEADGNIYLEV